MLVSTNGPVGKNNRVKVSSTWQNTIIMVAFYIMLARPVGRFFTVLRVNFPVMLGHLWTMAGPMPICRYPHRSSSPWSIQLWNSNQVKQNMSDRKTNSSPNCMYQKKNACCFLQLTVRLILYCCMTNYELLCWLVETQSRDVGHNRTSHSSSVWLCNM